MFNTDDDSLQLYKETIRRFADAEIQPHYSDWEKSEIFPRCVWNQLGTAGFLCADIPEVYGGAGASFEYSMAVVEALSEANLASFATSIAVHSDVVAHYILNHGSETQKLEYLPRMVDGSCIGAIAMTEPGAGSDLQGLRTNAKCTEGGFLINGSKTFITNGQHCDFVIVAAKTQLDVPGAKGTTLFIVDTTKKGFVRGRNLEKIGLHAGDTSELFFEDVYVSEHDILGELDAGFNVLMSELQRERLTLATSAVSAAEGVLRDTIAYVKDRKLFGSSLSAFQNTQFRLADLATDVQIHRVFVENCKYKFANKQLDVKTVSMAKLSATEMQGRVADACLQLYGGYGYMREYGISRAFVDSRVQRIYGGTSEIMRQIIGKAILS